MRNLRMKKKGAGLITGLVVSIAALVIAVIISFVIVNTLDDASLLTANSAQANATTRLIANYTAGIDNVSSKLPTVLLVAAVVLILGVLAILWATYSKMNMGGGGASL